MQKTTHFKRNLIANTSIYLEYNKSHIMLQVPSRNTHNTAGTS